MENLIKISKKVFVDTSAWIALINGSDTLHDQANEVIEKLSKQKYDLITKEFVILEVANELRNPIYGNRVAKYINDLRDNRKILIIPANTELF